MRRIIGEIMKIKYNNLSILIVVISIVTAITNYAFSKQKQKCFTCVCKNISGTNYITEPNCNFDSILTNKSMNDLPADIKNSCIQTCHNEKRQYANHLIWSE